MRCLPGIAPVYRLNWGDFHNLSGRVPNCFFWINTGQIETLHPIFGQRHVCAVGQQDRSFSCCFGTYERHRPWRIRLSSAVPASRAGFSGQDPQVAAIDETWQIQAVVRLQNQTVYRCIAVATQPERIRASRRILC